MQETFIIVKPGLHHPWNCFVHDVCVCMCGVLSIEGIIDHLHEMNLYNNQFNKLSGF